MNDKLASEVIADLNRQIHIMDDEIKGLDTDINKVRSVFKGIHYAMAGNGINESEADAALSGIQTMLDVLKDNSGDAVGLSNGILQGEMQEV